MSQACSSTLTMSALRPCNRDPLRRARCGVRRCPRRRNCRARLICSNPIARWSGSTPSYCRGRHSVWMPVRACKPTCESRGAVRHRNGPCAACLRSSAVRLLNGGDRTGGVFRPIGARRSRVRLRRDLRARNGRCRVGATGQWQVASALRRQHTGATRSGLWSRGMPAGASLGQRSALWAGPFEGKRGNLEDMVFPRPCRRRLSS
jgi:hypothetical protein